MFYVIIDFYIIKKMSSVVVSLFVVFKSPIYYRNGCFYSTYFSDCQPTKDHSTKS